jgi:uncharacterized protein (TIGR03545 family)
MRWKFVIPATVIVALVVAFNILFLDRIIKSLIISSGQAVFGAKVEISSLKTGFKDLSVRISGMAVADKAQPMRNLFEIDGIAFSVRPIPLLSKKVIIDKMSLKGLRWGTGRLSSGALPPRLAKKIDKAKKKEGDSLVAKLYGQISEKATKEINALPAFDTIRSASKALSGISVNSLSDVAGLETPKLIESIQKTTTEKVEKYKTEVQGIDFTAQLNVANQALIDLKNSKTDTIQDIAAIKDKIDRLNQARSKLSEELDTVNRLKASFAADIADKKDIIEQINQAKDRDYKKVSEKLKLPDTSFSNISESLFGPVWISRVNKAVYLVHLSRTLMPPRKKEDKQVVRPRLKGSDISFPVHNALPGFLIRDIDISGSTGGRGKDESQAMDFSGVVKDITSDPVLLGRPTVFRVEGAKQAQRLTIDGVFDHTGENASDTIKASVSGLSAKDLGVPSNDYFPSFQRSAVTVSADMVLKKDDLDSNALFVISGLGQPEFREGLDSSLQKTLAALYSGINDIDIKARVYGNVDRLNFAVSSNLGDLLSKKLQGALGAGIAEMNDKIKKQLEDITLAKKQELLGTFDSQKQAVMGLIDGKAGQLSSAIDQAQNLQKQKQSDADNYVQGQKKAAQDKLSEEKKKAENDLKKQAEEQLKNLFK